jgi:predicted O-linked N-acetylglucosamine transferase (SPINDLY family)
LEHLGITNAAQRILRAPICNTKPPGFTGALLNLADVCLSYRRFGGGLTFNQLLANGIPQIIWPNESYAGYICAGIYKQIGLEDLLVDNADAYVAGNIKLAVDKEYRDEVRRVFRFKVKTFYERLSRSDYTGSLAAFFQQAVSRARSGIPPAHWHRDHFYEKLTVENLRNFAINSDCSGFFSNAGGDTYD